MKKILLVLIIIFVFSLISNSFGQRWEYRTGGNVFDGKYKTSSILGFGNSKKPFFVVNMYENHDKLNVFIADADYTLCENKKAFIKFDNDKNHYLFNISTSPRSDAWFLEDGYSTSIVELLTKLKSHNKFYVRLSSDCEQNDYEFSLLGSVEAINFVVGNYIAKEMLVKEENKRKVKLINSGKPFKAKTKYNASVFYAPETSAFYNNILLTTGEEVIISYNFEILDYLILLKSSTVELPADSTFYISKSSVDLEFVEELKE